VTASDLEKSFSFDNTVEITSHVVMYAFRFMCKHTMQIRATFHELCELEMFQTAQVTFKVIRGHWQWCHSIGHIGLPISLPSQLRLSILHLFRQHLFSKIYRRHVTLNASHSWVIYHACNTFLCSLSISTRKSEM